MVLKRITSANPNPRSVTTKVPEVEIHLYRSGKGPIDVFRSSLGGWDQDRIEGQDILEKYGFKSLFAFNAESGRGVPIRFQCSEWPINPPVSRRFRHLRRWRSKGSHAKTCNKDYSRSCSYYSSHSHLREGDSAVVFKFTANTFPPWVIACMVIAFTRLRKRTKNFLKKFGW